MEIGFDALEAAFKAGYNSCWELRSEPRSKAHCEQAWDEYRSSLFEGAKTVKALARQLFPQYENSAISHIKALRQEADSQLGVWLGLKEAKNICDEVRHKIKQGK